MELDLETAWGLELEGKPDFDQAMRRIYAWYEQEMIDRPPIRFSAHNAEFESDKNTVRQWPSLKARWFDADYQVDQFLKSIKGRHFYAETFPVFWPNLGPGVYASFYGCPLEFADVTSWAHPIIQSPQDIEKLRMDRRNEYFTGIERLTQTALQACPGKFMVGYTDLHPGIDCAADWRGSEQLCIDMVLDPDFVQALSAKAIDEFQSVYDYFDGILKQHRQLSVTWMGIPSFGKMHIPSCDFSTLISPTLFDAFCLPVLRREVKPMTHNIFHLDGRGVAVHLDRILETPEINAIQWVQGVGDDTPIMQWLDIIKKIQRAGKSVVVDLQLDELDAFVEQMDSKGLFLCIAADEKLHPDIIRRVEKW